MNEHILKTVSQGIAAQRQRQKIEQARQMPAMAPPPMPMPGDEAARLQAEADTYLAAMKAPMPAPSLPPIATPRRSLPVAAPVSRDVPTASGQKLSAQQTVTLGAEEREKSPIKVMDG